MNINEYAEQIYRSSTSDWRVETCWGAFSAPSFRNSFAVWTREGDDTWGLDIKSYTNLASFRPDLSISFAWGYPCNEDFQKTWANQFPDKSASSSYIDFYYNGTLVFRDMYVIVDGGRCYLPLPNQVLNETTNKITALTVPRTKAAFYRMLNHLTSSVDYDSYFDCAGFTVTDEAWIER